MRYRSLASGLAADARRAAWIATGALGAVAAIELIATIVAYTGPIHVIGTAKLISLDLTLIALAWLAAVPVCAGLAIVPRLLVAATRGGVAARDHTGPGTAALSGQAIARAWGFGIAAALFVLWSSRATFHATLVYKEYRLMGLLLALQQLVVIAVLGVAGVALSAAADRVRRLIDRVAIARAVNPLGRALPAVGLGVIIAAVVLLITAQRMPQLRPLIPWRWMLAALAAYTGGALMLARLRRGPILAEPPRRRRVALAVAGAMLLVVPATLLRLGGDVDAKGMAITASPLFEKLIALVRVANDLDRDGFGSLLGENDCAPLDARIHPGARDLPDNGVDENCNGRDSSMHDLVAPAGAKVPVPAAFHKPWNVLLITVDAVRYDHTSFGGYRATKHRDTTPRLAELVDRAVSFSFANAPSAGTMASVPAILTSKFFHSGIALAEPHHPKMPPRLKPENTTLPEIMKRGGYTTAAILSHEYFNDWGMEQGVDHYDNEIGKVPDPFRISSPQSTDRAIAWISSHASSKWFLWVHYLDPHGRYVAHPDGPSWGDSEEDLYDGELHYADQHIGRLLDELARLPGADHTIVVVTSDHGDAFNEHGFTNHGQALYRELLNVPLIVAIPDLPPRKIDGAVTPLDIVPTVADLCGIDVSDLQFEGRSLVPQIFYGTPDPARVVFAETNYPKPLRAAVSARWKLIYDLQNNLYQLFDLRSDPGEKANLATRDPQALAEMKEQLDGWLERVMFARDPVFNQASEKMAGVLLATRPAPRFAVAGTHFDGGRIEVIGYDAAATAAPGEKLTVSVDLAVKDRPSGSFKLQLLAWPVTAATFDPHGPLGKRVVRSPLRITAEGYLPSDRWRPGEFIHESFELAVAADWGSAVAPGDALAIGLTMQGPAGKVAVAGALPSGDPSTAVLGTLPLARPAEKPGLDAGMPVPPIKAVVPAGGSGARTP